MPCEITFPSNKNRSQMDQMHCGDQYSQIFYIPMLSPIVPTQQQEEWRLTKEPWQQVI